VALTNRIRIGESKVGDTDNRLRIARPKRPDSLELFN
jgi:hypothetical protein